MIRRVLALSLTIALALCFVGCAAPVDELVGVWKLDDGEPTTYGIAMAFYDDGSMIYGLTKADEGMDSPEGYASMLKILSQLVSMTYRITRDGIEITSTAYSNDKKIDEKNTVSYAVDGDSLTFDGIRFTRMNP